MNTRQTVTYRGKEVEPAELLGELLTTKGEEWEFQSILSQLVYEGWGIHFAPESQPAYPPHLKPTTAFALGIKRTSSVPSIAG